MRLANPEPPDPLRSFRRWEKRRDLFHLIGCLVLLALGIVALTRDPSKVFLWVGTLLFAAGSLVFGWSLVTGRDLIPAPERKKWRKITFDSTGFFITRQTLRAKSMSMLWSEVHFAIAFKRDEFTVDCICLLFAREDGTGVEADEEMEGWDEFTRALPTYLPGCRPWENWFMEVVSPAFAPNPTEIFSRKIEVKVTQGQGGPSS